MKKTTQLALENENAMCNIKLDTTEILASLWSTPSLPKVVKRRIRALKNTQLETIRIEQKFHEEVHRLKCKYLQLFNTLFEKRAKLVKGELEASDSEHDDENNSDDERETPEMEIDQPEEENTIDTIINKIVHSMGINEKTLESKEEEESYEEVNTGEDDNVEEDEEDDDLTEGIPNFWLKTMRKVSFLERLIRAADIPLLRHLIDIKVVSMTEAMGFSLEFYFTPNTYFENSVLRKRYIMDCSIHPDNPLGFEGPKIVQCEADPIVWKKGKNLTLKTMRKRQKHRGQGEVRTIITTLRSDSFFQFFIPPLFYVPAWYNGDGCEEENILISIDHEIGVFIADRLVPRAFIYFTENVCEDELKIIELMNKWIHSRYREKFVAQLMVNNKKNFQNNFNKMIKYAQDNFY